MKKFIGVIIASAVAFGAGAVFGGCGLFSKNVSTFEQLKDANGKVKLTADIDCGYETLKAIECDSFDGQGYTIKNCVVSANSTSDIAALFKAKEVKNLTLDNITVTGNASYGVGIVSDGYSKKIDNVHIKNSNVTGVQAYYGNGAGRGVQEIYLGAIYGGAYYYDYTGAIEKNFDCEITNCSVENTKIEVKKSSYETVRNNMYVGGIAGAANKVTGCFVKDCKISAQSADIFNYPYVGGAVGYSEGSVENTSSTGNTLSATANWYQSSLIGGSASSAYSGGIAAYIKSSGSIFTCYADSNEITVSSSGDAYAGGLAGYINGTSVSQSYSHDCEIRMKGFQKGANKGSEVHRRAGGLIGSINNGSVSSSFAYNGEDIAEESEVNSANHSKVAGLIAGFGSITVKNCATFNHNIETDSAKDEFIPSSCDGVKDCYVSKTDNGNVNGCEVAEETFWISPNTVKNALKLTSYYWTFETGKIPRLDLTKE